MGKKKLKVKTLLLKHCFLHKFHVIIIDGQNTCDFKLKVIEGPNAHDQITCDTFHSFLVEVQVKLATHCIYILCMYNLIAT